jgi:DNA-binding beta-propeller fold protein YncE
MYRVSLSVLLIGLLIGSSCNAGTPSSSPSSSFDPLFSLVGDFALGEATDRVDYQSVDSTSQRLYIAKMGAGKLLVFDLVHNRVSAELDGLPKITGVLAVPELHRLYASVPGAGLVPSLLVGLGMMGLTSGDGALVVLDTANLREIARLPGGVFPDGIAYDPKDHRIFVSDELGSAVLVIDANANRLVARIATGGEVGNVRYDPLTSEVYAPIQSRDELAVIDPVKAAVVSKYSLAGGRHPHGLAIAPGAAIGYIACDANDVLLAVDLTTGHILGRWPVAHDPDVLAVDPESKRLYVATESGTLSTFDITHASSPIVLRDVFVGENAHSVAVDPITHRLYFPLANLHGHSILRVLSPKRDSTHS